MSEIEVEHECHVHAPPKAMSPATAALLGSVPSVAFSRQLRAESKNCRTTNGAIMLQAVAAWMEGFEIFDESEEIWQTADRLCKCPRCKTCPQCGGLIITVENDQLCGCQSIAVAPITAAEFPYPLEPGK